MAQFIKALEVVRGGYIRITPTDTQFDPNLLAPYVDNAERRYVRNLIGAAFFDELKANRTANVINYNPAFGAIEPAFTDTDLENLFLDGKLFDLLGFAVLEESLSFAHFKITSAGVQVTQANFATAATGNDMRYLKDTLKDKIQFLQQEVITYLCDNSALYVPFDFEPEGKCQCCKPKNKNISTFPIIY
jgi:hypothetical protein